MKIINVEQSPLDKELKLTRLVNQSFALYQRLSNLSRDYSQNQYTHDRCIKLSDLAFTRYQRRHGAKYDHQRLTTDYLQVLINTK